MAEPRRVTLDETLELLHRADVSGRHVGDVASCQQCGALRQKAQEAVYEKERREASR